MDNSTSSPCHPLTLAPARAPQFASYCSRREIVAAWGNGSKCVRPLPVMAAVISPCVLMAVLDEECIALLNPGSDCSGQVEISGCSSPLSLGIKDRHSIRPDQVHTGHVKKPLISMKTGVEQHKVCLPVHRLSIFDNLTIDCRHQRHLLQRDRHRCCLRQEPRWIAC